MRRKNYPQIQSNYFFYNIFIRQELLVRYNFANLESIPKFQSSKFIMFKKKPNRDNFFFEFLLAQKLNKVKSLDLLYYNNLSRKKSFEIISLLYFLIYNQDLNLDNSKLDILKFPILLKSDKVIMDHKHSLLLKWSHGIPMEFLKNSIMNINSNFSIRLFFSKTKFKILTGLSFYVYIYIVFLSIMGLKFVLLAKSK